MKIIESQTIETRSQPKPVEAPSKDQVIRSICADARIRPEKFVKESTVLFGGE
ncbi:MAG: hypothetical protein AAF497_22695 [Planctomycetota bacterium]